MLTGGLALGAVVAGSPAPAHAQRTARVVVVDERVPPAAEEVAGRLRELLAPAPIAVDVHGSAARIGDDDEWVALARRLAGERPGTLAVAGWREEEAAWALLVVEPMGGGLARIPASGREPGPELIEALASTLAEAILGGLIPELHRLSGERAGGDHRHAAGADEEPEETAELEEDRAAMPLWIEGGYLGEYAHPGYRPIHGPFIGVSVPVLPGVAPTLGLGWLGIQRREGAAGGMVAHRLPVLLALRLLFRAGSAAFSIAPAGRLDTLLVRSDPATGDADVSAHLELHVGGIASWHLKLPGGFEALVGAGALATVLGDDREIDGERLLAGSAVRLVWLAGLGWNPRGR